MALLIDTNQNAYPSAANPDGSAAFPISINAAGVTEGQGSATAGQAGVLVQAAATTAAPTYVNGTTNPLSTDLAGNLRVNVVTGGGGGGGGGAVTAASGAFVDGSIATIGTEADAAWSGSGSSTLIAALKAIYAKVAGSLAVTGTFWQATQPVSAASLPLPALAASSTLQNTINTTLGTPMQQTGGSLSVTNFPATQPVSIASMPSTPVTGTFWQATQPVSGTFWQATQPISVAALPLPADAAQETGGNLAAIAAGTPASLGQLSMAKSQPVVIASDQPIPCGDRLRNVFLAEQLLFAMSSPTNGFVPVEIPSFLTAL